MAATKQATTKRASTKPKTAAAKPKAPARSAAKGRVAAKAGGTAKASGRKAPTAKAAKAAPRGAKTASRTPKAAGKTTTGPARPKRLTPQGRGTSKAAAQGSQGGLPAPTIQPAAGVRRDPRQDMTGRAVARNDPVVNWGRKAPHAKGE